jgi:hypothetical protein
MNLTGWSWGLLLFGLRSGFLFNTTCRGCDTTISVIVVYLGYDYDSVVLWTIVATSFNRPIIPLTFIINQYFDLQQWLLILSLLPLFQYHSWLCILLLLLCIIWFDILLLVLTIVHEVSLIFLEILKLVLDLLRSKWFFNVRFTWGLLRFWQGYLKPI